MNSKPKIRNDSDQLVTDEDAKLKNIRSKQAFPDLNLSENEYIIFAVKRHFIGLFAPLLLGATLIIIALAALINYRYIADSLEINGGAIEPASIIFPIILFIAIVALVMYVIYYVYSRNRFFLTNESVIQEIQISLFSRREQTVSLANIEDASYTQDGILQQIFNYGSIRLSTVGDENTYRFSYVEQPDKQINILNNAVEAFNNGRPVNNG